MSGVNNETKTSPACRITVNSAGVEIIGTDNDAVTPATDRVLTLNTSNKTSGTLTASVSPSNIMVISQSWMSSNPYVASVTTGNEQTQGGLVTSIAKGEATITVSVTTSVGTFYSSCKVKVQ